MSGQCLEGINISDSEPILAIMYEGISVIFNIHFQITIYVGISFQCDFAMIDVGIKFHSYFKLHSSVDESNY